MGSGSWSHTWFCLRPSRVVPDAAESTGAVFAHQEVLMVQKPAARGAARDPLTLRSFPPLQPPPAGQLTPPCPSITPGFQATVKNLPRQDNGSPGSPFTPGEKGEVINGRSPAGDGRWMPPLCCGRAALCLAPGRGRARGFGFPSSLSLGSSVAVLEPGLPAWSPPCRIRRIPSGCCPVSSCAPGEPSCAPRHPRSYLQTYFSTSRRHLLHTT